VEYSSSIKTFNTDSGLVSFELIVSVNMILSLLSSRVIKFENQSDSVCSSEFSINENERFSKRNSLLLVVVAGKL
jgi:hypothetical protein